MINPGNVRTVEDLNDFFKSAKEEREMDFFVTDITFTMPEIVNKDLINGTIPNFFQKTSVTGSMTVEISYKQEI